MDEPSTSESDDAERPALPPMPEKPALVPVSEKRSSSKISSLVLSLAGVIAIAVILFICSGGNVAAVIAAFVLFFFAILHYLVWGSRLSKQLNQETREESQSSATQHSD